MRNQVYSGYLLVKPNVERETGSDTTVLEQNVPGPA